MAISNPVSCKMMGSLASCCGKRIQDVQSIQALSSEIHSHLANGISFTISCINVPVLL